MGCFRKLWQRKRSYKKSKENDFQSLFKGFSHSKIILEKKVIGISLKKLDK
jgi:hypothetical protein